MAQPSPDLIRGIPIFSDLDDASVKQLSSDFIEREFAAGLGSVVVGEGEIAGQVRRALERARTEGTTTPELERLFQRLLSLRILALCKLGAGLQTMPVLLPQAGRNLLL